LTQFILHSRGSWGKSAFFFDPGYKVIVNTSTIRIHPYIPESSRFYLKCFLDSNFFKHQMIDQLVGMQPNFGSTHFLKILVPTPPSYEQFRIAEKANELLELCDQLEEQQIKNLTTHHQLVKCLLEALTQTAYDRELQASWERVSHYFDTLFCTEDSIDQLKETILQLAIMGKLVKQNPNDEPTRELMGKIEKQKAKLVNDNIIKNEKILPDVSDEEQPFSLPGSWEWVRLGNMTNKIGSGSTPRGGNNSYSDSGILFLRSQNIRNEGLLLDDVAYIDEETNERMRNTVVFPKDILLNITGGSLGRCTIFPEEAKIANVSQHVTIIRPTIMDSCFYLHSCITSPYIQNLIWGRQVGANREGLSKRILEQFEIPYPPLAEQKRIVSRIQDLFVICDLIKGRIQRTQKIESALSLTVLEIV
jgi:type I restriction enzyme, S subunit